MNVQKDFLLMTEKTPGMTSKGNRRNNTKIKRMYRVLKQAIIHETFTKKIRITERTYGSRIKF